MDKKKEIKKYTAALNKNFDIELESVKEIEAVIEKFRDSRSGETEALEDDLASLHYIAKNLRDNFQFTISIVEYLQNIQKTVKELNEAMILLSLKISTIENQEIKDSLIDVFKNTKEKEDALFNLVDEVLTAEVNNKTFIEHGRFVNNVVLPQISEKIEELGKEIKSSEELSSKFSKLFELVEDMKLLNSGNRTILKNLENIAGECSETQNQDSGQGGFSTSHKPVIKRPLGEIRRPTKSF
jgi:hypothetical protein